jgi:hypothetical protein
MPTYERVLAALIADDPEDSLCFHRLMDARPTEAERGTAMTLAIHYSVVRDHIRGFVMPPYDDWALIAEQTSQIERWRDQILERWSAADRLEELRAMPYRAYLRTPEWQARRRVALADALHRCEVCNASGDLDVHHRTYERLAAEDKADLTVLCRSCHGLFHEYRDLN